MTIKYINIDISPAINNKGATYSNYEDGFLSMGLSSLPAAEIPFSSEMVYQSVPFRFYSNERGDNIELSGQSLLFEELKVKKIHILGGSSHGDYFENIYLLHNEKTVFKGIFNLTNFISEESAPEFMNSPAIVFSCLHTVSGKKNNYKPIMWYSCIDVNEHVNANKLVFEDNPFMHVFSLTLEIA